MNKTLYQTNCNFCDNAKSMVAGADNGPWNHLNGTDIDICPTCSAKPVATLIATFKAPTITNGPSAPTAIQAGAGNLTPAQMLQGLQQIMRRDPASVAKFIQANIVPPPAPQPAAPAATSAPAAKIN